MLATYVNEEHILQSGGRLCFTKYGASYHLGQIPAGYARVGVDAIIPGFEALELDYPGGDDETQMHFGRTLHDDATIV